jgi:uncharacterized protein YndB with AHSA1/START domain
MFAVFRHRALAVSDWGVPSVVSVERLIAADPQRIFDVLADPAQHQVIDGSGTVRDVQPGGPQRLSLGARFGMNMRLVVPYKILNTVVEFDEPRRIAWRHFFGHVWRYTLEPGPGGTLVREEWDPKPALLPCALVALGYPHRSRVGMHATLQRLDALVTS